ncbi:hypothetical protein [Qipengyuania sp. RANM35]|uniref:hypothetical protein n=1 Tax=Qipengyuania sp. RANM35 TaxID=3068635 RepID=UPI0034DB1EF3
MNGTASKRPISSHPAFRWAVGLWFAALLGAGLFVMPEGIHTSIRQALGIDALIPVGVVGKAILAGAAALFGLALGIVLAMRVAALNSASEFDDEDEYDEVAWQGGDAVEVVETPSEMEEPRRPFSPREYFGDEPQDRDPAPVEELFDEDFAEFDEVDDEAGAEVEPVVIAAEEVALAEAREPAPVMPEEAEETEALGDLPLAVLTQRLKRALDASRAASTEPAPVDDGELDPVIAFLRREADRSAPASAPEANEDAQAALRSALDRLSQVGKPQ